MGLLVVSLLLWNPKQSEARIAAVSPETVTLSVQTVPSQKSRQVKWNCHADEHNCFPFQRVAVPQFQGIAPVTVSHSHSTAGLRVDLLL